MEICEMHFSRRYTRRDMTENDNDDGDDGVWRANGCVNELRVREAGRQNESYELKDTGKIGGMYATLEKEKKETDKGRDTSVKSFFTTGNLSASIERSAKLFDPYQAGKLKKQRSKTARCESDKLRRWDYMPSVE
ncbi:hypothetical protein PV326_014114 [Microctonus aethiopoides]|nr:hypothetical protein PV326_014114 [Microctonus aethiopoides]